ncbi:hypothetical protein MMC18_002648 [Xylographa bjoerkii]|nr:hypothetical protein [Xylographa bjoerkii]
MDFVRGLFRRPNLPLATCCSQCGAEQAPPPYTKEDTFFNNNKPFRLANVDPSSFINSNQLSKSRRKLLNTSRIEELRHFLRLCTAQEYQWMDPQIMSEMALEGYSLKYTATPDPWLQLCGRFYDLRNSWARSNRWEVSNEQLELVIHPLQALGLHDGLVEHRTAQVARLERRKIGPERYLAVLVQEGQWKRLAQKLLYNERVLLPTLFTSPALWHAHQNLKALLFDRLINLSDFVVSRYSKQLHIEAVRQGLRKYPTIDEYLVLRKSSFIC